MIYNASIYYVWLGASCDYAHKERVSSGAYRAELGGKVIDSFICTDDHTTEFRILLTAMIHALETLPEISDIVFMTNVAYLQNFNRKPTPETANADLISRCRELIPRHASVSVKIVPYHKYPMLSELHQLTHEALLSLRP
jgi:ribonuclease HI